MRPEDGTGQTGGAVRPPAGGFEVRALEPVYAVVVEPVLSLSPMRVAGLGRGPRAALGLLSEPEQPAVVRREKQGSVDAPGGRGRVALSQEQLRPERFHFDAGRASRGR